MTEADVAGYLNRSLTWFLQHKAELLEAGFLPKLPIIDLYDREAVDRWLDKQGDPDSPRAARCSATARRAWRVEAGDRGTAGLAPAGSG
jgi:hypothetical protein